MSTCVNNANFFPEAAMHIDDQDNVLHPHALHTDDAFELDDIADALPEVDEEDFFEHPDDPAPPYEEVIAADALEELFEQPARLAYPSRDWVLDALATVPPAGFMPHFEADDYYFDVPLPNGWEIPQIGQGLDALLQYDYAAEPAAGWWTVGQEVDVQYEVNNQEPAIYLPPATVTVTETVHCVFDHQGRPSQYVVDTTTRSTAWDMVDAEYYRPHFDQFGGVEYVEAY
ncbi:hypothetical protein CVT26_000886 [Gymnopilus dilepis]|uniref:Uncharacterized protein n=1 Tax=Gymnopilus dilepis TaxID=231916 RepID=A0A409WBA1_9AGAR|nr:hypothetical protein CVT26_000886 [Gymnopilus dilepis]